MEYLVATLLFGSLAVILWSKNGRISSPHLTQDHQQIERIEQLLQEIQANRQSKQDYSGDNAQLTRIEQKIDRILQEFDIKDGSNRANYDIQLQTEFDVMLEQFPATQKIAVLKAVRMITGLGLKEAKNLIESPLPVVVKQRLSELEAETAQKMLQEAGARVSLR